MFGSSFPTIALWLSCSATNCSRESGVVTSIASPSNQPSLHRRLDAMVSETTCNAPSAQCTNGKLVRHPSRLMLATSRLKLRARHITGIALKQL